MNVEIPFGEKLYSLMIDLPEGQVQVLRAKHPAPPGDWGEVVEKGLAFPIGAEPISKQNLRHKKVIILTDDRARPTKTSAMLPPVIAEVHAAGARIEDITIMTAGGMHDPMTEGERKEKLGAEIVGRYRCVAHDCDDYEGLAFCGLTPLGIPLWVNREVVEADYRIAVGRVYLHPSYGYEGGSKMILPGVSGFDTVATHHSLAFRPGCFQGANDTPTRVEADAAGQMVGLDFLVNVAVTSLNEPIRAFCGEMLRAHRQGVEFGDREVWGVEVGKEADITIVSPGSGKARTEGYSEGALYKAAAVTKEGGWVILVTPQNGTKIDERGSDGFADEDFCRQEPEKFTKALNRLPNAELIRLHHKRDWKVPKRWQQKYLRVIRLEFYRRYRLAEIAKRNVILTPEPQKGLEEALAAAGGRPEKVLVLPEGKKTMPKLNLFKA